MAITTRNYRGLTPAVPRRERDCRGGYRKMMTGGLHLSLGRRESAYPFGFNLRVGRGRNARWAGLFPRGPVLVFIFFSSFPFLFFLIPS
jgi:hypothetical protein